MLGSPILISTLCWVFLTSLTVKGEECADRCDLYHGHCDEEGLCRCDPGWDGLYCEDCVRMPGCVHGVCHQPWQCMCQNAWAGKFCDKDLHICDNANPCQNGGLCSVSEDGEYSCDCQESFHGKNCELKRGPCQAEGFPCQNGGSCQDDGGFAVGLSCRCLAGYVGRLCETDVDDCLMRPCANGATCVDGVNRFSCQCPAGFQGRFCTVNVDDCAGQPCHNGGRCFDRVGDYECYCPEGFTGKSCEIPTSGATWEDQGGPSTREPPAQTKPTRTSPVSTDKGGHVKISVKEVVTQREAGLSNVQLMVVIVFGVTTGVVVLLTGALIVWYKCRVSGQPGWCSNSPEENKTCYEQCHGTAPEKRKTTAF